MTKKINIGNNKSKSQKFKVLTSVFSLGLALGLGVTLTACNTNNPPKTPTILVENVSALVDDYYQDTKSFLDNEVLENVVKFSTTTYDETKLIDATYDLGNGEQESLGFVKVIFTYKNGEDRLYNINEMTFETGIDLSKIADYDANKTELAQIADDATISTRYTTTYDAVESVQNDALAEAIFKNVIKSNENIVHLTLKNMGSNEEVVDDVIYPFNKYELIAQTDKSVKSYNISIKAQDNVNDMIASLSDSKNYKLKGTTDIENVETTIEYKEYEKEDIEVPPVVEKIDNIGELLQDYSAETYTFLDNQTKNAVEAVVGEYSQDNLKALKYDIGEDSKTALDNVKVELVYSDSLVEGKETYYRATINFASPIDLNAIADGTATATVANASDKYTFDYNAKEMYFRQGLVDALVAKTGYTLTDNSHVMVQFGEDVNGTTAYNMVISSDAGYNEYEFEVPTGVNEAETIKNIESYDVITLQTSSSTVNGYIQTSYTKQEYTIDDIDEALTFYSEQINANLQPVYESVLTRANAKAQNVTNYKWDLGEVIDGKIQNLKLAFTVSVGNYSDYNVYKIKLPTPVSIGDLLKSDTFKDMTIPKGNISNEYLYGYDHTLQGDKDDFIKAVGNKLAEADFDVENSILLYKETSGMTTRGFQIVLISEHGVREFNIAVPKGVSDDELVNAVEDLIEGTSKSVDFTDNQINVNLVPETELSNL